MPNLEGLPIFESKRDGRIRRGHDLWDSPLRATASTNLG